MTPLIEIELPEKAVPLLLQFLTNTISRYEDRKSRLIVERVLVELISKSEFALRTLVFLLADSASEATKKGSEG